MHKKGVNPHKKGFKPFLEILYAMAGFVLMVGIHSAGKTTIMHQLAERMPNTDCVSGGREKNQILSEQKIQKTLCELNQPESLFVNRLFFEKLLRRYAGSDKLVIVNMHTTHSHPTAKDSFVRLIPEKFIKQIQKIILLKVEPVEAIRRRTLRGNDPNKNPRNFLQVSREYLAEALEARFLASKYEIPLLVMPANIPQEVLVNKAISFISRKPQRKKTLRRLKREIPKRQQRRI